MLFATSLRVALSYGVIFHDEKMKSDRCLDLIDLFGKKIIYEETNNE